MNYFKQDKDKKIFYCPACGCNHFVDNRWTITWNIEGEPTVRPSVSTRLKLNDKPIICHLVITHGVVQYLGHHARGAKRWIPMEEII